MRLTGSFQTIVTQGLSTSVISSGVRSGSTSTGLAVLTSSSWHTRARGPLPAPAPRLSGCRRPRCSPTTTSSPCCRPRCAAGPRIDARSSSCSPDGSPRGDATESSPGSGGPSTRSRTSASTTRPSPSCATAVVVDEPTLEWLAAYRFSGDVWGYAEGEAYFPYSPVLIVEGTFAEAVVLETLLLSIYNHDSAIASAASRMTQAADGRPCIEMGSRRTHEEAAVASARAAYIAGFASSSNLAARQRYDVPTAGTSAHSFTLLHDTEADAFRAQVDSLGVGTTLLVDTYDIAEAVQPRHRDRGHRARRGADRLGRPRCPGAPGARASSTRSARPPPGSSSPATSTSTPSPPSPPRPSTATASAPSWSPVGSPDERDGLQAGRARVRAPAGELVSVAKKSTDKISIGGRKFALRRRDPDGTAEAEIIGIGTPPVDDGDDRDLLVRLVRGGEVVGREPLSAARDRHVAARAELPLEAQQLSKGEPVIETVHLSSAPARSQHPADLP